MTVLPKYWIENSTMIVNVAHIFNKNIVIGDVKCCTQCCTTKYVSKKMLHETVWRTERATFFYEVINMRATEFGPVHVSNDGIFQRCVQHSLSSIEIFMLFSNLRHWVVQHWRCVFTPVQHWLTSTVILTDFSIYVIRACNIDGAFLPPCNID